MKKLLLGFLVLGFLAGGAGGCAEQTVTPAANSNVQKVYAANNNLILAENALNLLYKKELERRTTDPKGKVLLTDSAYDTAYTLQLEAEKILTQAMAVARGPRGDGSDGMSAQNLLDQAQKKVDQINKVAGVPPK